MNARYFTLVLLAASSALIISCRSQEPAATEPSAATESAVAAKTAQVPQAESQAPTGRPAVGRPRQTAPKTAAVRPPAAVAPVAPLVQTFTVPEGTPLRVRTTSTLSTKAVQTGANFTASLEEPLIAGNTVIAPKGALVEGRVVESDPGGRVKGVASMTLQLTSLQLEGGKSMPISSDTVVRQANTTKKKDAMKVGIGAGIGAAIGAIAGGGKGAGIGAAVGSAGGTGAVLATRGEPAVIPAETVLTFSLQTPVTVTK